jgi:glycosyltransferase involved in cell wall biosynthesis
VRIRDDRPLLVRTPSLLQRAWGAAFDAVIVGFRAHSDMFAARLVARSRPVPLIFDPLTSRYEERVIDRQQVRPGSWLSRWYHMTDAAGCRAADRLVLETDAQIAYFVDTFAVPRARCRRLWLGADDDVMRPLPTVTKCDAFTVFFYGRFSPLHGVEHIVRAAAHLELQREAVRFVLVGAGQTYQMARRLADQLEVSTIRFLDPVPYAHLAAMMSEADVCLGSFGTTARAQRVIPNKVFDALAVGRAIVTGDSPASREILVHAHNAWLCPCGDAEALADSLVRLKRDPDLRETIARRGHELFIEHFSLEAMTRAVAGIVGELVRGHGAPAISR